MSAAGQHREPIAIATRWCAADRDRFLATLFAPADAGLRCSRSTLSTLEIARVRELVREPMPGEIRLQWWREALAGCARARRRPSGDAAALRDAVARNDCRAACADRRALDLYDEPMARSATRICAADLVRDDRRWRRAVLRRPRSGAAISLAAPASPMRLRAAAALPLHAARGSSFCRSICAALRREPDAFAGKATPLRAVLTDCVSAGAGRRAPAATRRALPAFLPAALVRPALERMERRYRPFGRGAAAMAAADGAAGARRWFGLSRSSSLLGRAARAAADPALEIGQRAGASAPLARQVFWPSRGRTCGRRVEGDGFIERRKQAEIDVHRLERARARRRSSRYGRR